MRINFFTTEKTKCWLSMDIHYQISLQWRDWALESMVTCQRLHRDLWYYYFETFSMVARLYSFHIILSVMVVKQWPLYQLDIKKKFLHRDLQEEMYMLQPPSYEVQGEKKSTNSKKQFMIWSKLHEYGLTNSILLLHTIEWDGALLVMLYL